MSWGLTPNCPRNQSGLSVLRPVVEKEILHHDILRELSHADLLQRLTFIGGTCLRACYASNRMSEDPYFTGCADFKELCELGSAPTLSVALGNSRSFG
ncbi:nucleotidyl transferase AbiEii/AbiGii toxin family protein [Marinobacter sp. ATCH36]|uniref:nucleotidyl transferase AbiEii/AbiGii toxin family protein n=1 Tax=Marinobacter sp. ATCH36 TaxID=2945106 RepID=UPI002020228B|nr:nucleotidyl transferase AbiEii/AbiGii toxin family protein [Marinobacter sp. ATCH36]MCL7945172.1 nucleotidyl transferase AbiEii/AbiGii toxin family protein [Marinobacter sp. ATCH36]